MAKKKFNRVLTQQEKDYLYLINAGLPPRTDLLVALSVLSEFLLAHERQFINTLAHAFGEEMTKRFVIHTDYSGFGGTLNGGDKNEN